MMRSRCAGLLPALLGLLAVGAARAETTTGGVTWLDSLSYTKPAFYPITVPTEASVSNKYYVDFTSGSGTTCSSGSPCGSLSSVAGKAGMSGGPAYVYVRGNQSPMQLTSGNFFGSAGNEIVIKPWPGDSTPTVWTAASGCTTSNANGFAASTVHHVIVDGGPDGLITFKGSGCTTDQNGYTALIISNDITLYRVRIDANGSSGPALGWATGEGTTTNNTRIINTEIYGATLYYGIYVGGGANCASGNSAMNNAELRNSIIRDVDGRGIQVETRTPGASAGLIIDGNAFHNVGKGGGSACSYGISQGVQLANACRGAVVTGTKVTNNLFFDMGGGMVQAFPVDDTTQLIANNTEYDYAKSACTASAQSHGMNASGSNAGIYNNIILAPAQGGLDSIYDRANLVSGNNLCQSGSTTCGASSLTSTAASVFQSTSTGSANFLKPAAGGPAENAGTNKYASGVVTDYLGAARPSSGSVEIGAMEIGSGTGLNGSAALTEAADTVAATTTTVNDGPFAATEAADTLAGVGGTGACAGTYRVVTPPTGAETALHRVAGAWVPCTAASPTLLCDKSLGTIWTICNGGDCRQQQRRNKAWVSCP